MKLIHFGFPNGWCVVCNANTRKKKNSGLPFHFALVARAKMCYHTEPTTNYGFANNNALLQGFVVPNPIAITQTELDDNKQQQQQLQLQSCQRVARQSICNIYGIGTSNPNIAAQSYRALNHLFFSSASSYVHFFPALTLFRSLPLTQKICLLFSCLFCAMASNAEIK